jgi:hypothetical protein
MYRSEGQHFDARAAISRGARMLAKALELQSTPNEGGDGDGDTDTEEILVVAPGTLLVPEQLLCEASDLHAELTGKPGSMADTDDDYAALMFYWSR